MKKINKIKGNKNTTIVSKNITINNTTDKKSNEKPYSLKEVILTLSGISGIIALIKTKNIETVNIPHFEILFFVALIPIIISFIVALKKKEGKSFTLISIILYWGVILIFLSSFFLILTSAFFEYPKKICEYPFIECKTENKTPADTSFTKDTTRINEIDTTEIIVTEHPIINEDIIFEFVRLTISMPPKRIKRIIYGNNKIVTFIENNEIQCVFEIPKRSYKLKIIYEDDSFVELSKTKYSQNKLLTL